MPDNRLVLSEYPGCHRDELITYLTWRLGSADLARAVAVEALNIVCSSPPRCPVSDVRGYLFQLAARIGIDHLLRESVTRLVRRQLSECAAERPGSAHETQGEWTGGMQPRMTG